MSVTRGLQLALAATLLLAVVFAAFPRADLPVSALFYRPDQGFWTAQLDWAQSLRHGIWIVSIITALAAIVLLPLRLIVRPLRRINPRALGVVFLSYLMGPGLVANGMFKAYWGRARPRDITEFGGPLTFSGPLTPSDQCPANCSFVSGEASGAVTTALLFTLFLRAYVPAQRRWIFDISVLTFALLGSGLRIAMGGHFLSDTLFAASLMALVVLGLTHALKAQDNPLIMAPKS